MNPYTHFYLYAKGHYATTNIMNDLKVILSKHSKIDIKEISEIDVVKILGEIIYPHIKKFDYVYYQLLDDLNPDGFVSTLQRKFGDKLVDKNKDYNFNKKFIESCLKILRWCDIKDIEGGLGKADENILELKEK